METLTIELRAEAEDDREFLCLLYRDTRSREVAQWGWATEQAELFLAMQFEAQRRGYRQMYPRAEARIVQIAGRDAGRLLVDCEETGMHLIDIALLEPYRNRGIGTGLLLGLQRRCREDGLALRLQALAGNPARRLYTRLGFAEVGGDAMYTRMEWLPGSSPEVG